MLRRNANFKAVTPPVAAVAVLVILVAIFFFVNSPNSAIKSSPLPQGLSLQSSGQSSGGRAAPTPPAQALAVPTALPTLAPATTIKSGLPSRTPTSAATQAAATNTAAPTQTTTAPTTTSAQTTATTAVATTAVATTPAATTTAATPQAATTAPATESPAATPAPTEPPTTTAPSGIIPARLRIPTIGVDAEVERVGQTKEGAMDVPKGFWDVGWYEPGTKPGATGSAVIAGHLDSTTGVAIFWDLKKLKPGQNVFVTDGEGKELTFEVTATETYPYDEAPLDKIFDNNEGESLNLITCNGTFDNRSHNYDKRLVVYTKLVKEGE